ncbi:prodigiosin synthesizing transferase PigC-like [Patiria miniata]|uniref:Phosphoenolpyruvate synthase n=1 Tax=Patiria miniata TaxID=46514 RepID=A0A914AYC8_PATMI|nr:prodigiosin synthesizing transferase PigC-like [Patiria miniata]
MDAFIWLSTLGVILLAVIYFAVKLSAGSPGLPPRDASHTIPWPWYTFKFYLVRVLLMIRRRKLLHIRRRAEDYKAMLKDFRELATFDCSTDTDLTPHGNNSFYVNGSDQTGATRLVACVANRPEGRRDVWFLLRLPGLGDLVLPQHPHCVVDNIHGSGFSAAGLSFTVTDPLKIWRISFNGLCRMGKRNELDDEDRRPQVHLRCSFIWSTFTTYFNFSTDVSPCLLAESIAKETWTKEFLTKCCEVSTEHRLQQFGVLHGVVQVDDQTEREVLMRGVRDRSRGTIDFSDIHRGISISIVLEDGMCVYVGTSCKRGSPLSSTSGYVIRAIGGVIPVVSTDLSLADMMENAEDPPIGFSFSAQLETGKKLAVDVYIEDFVSFNIGSDWSVRQREGLSRFTVDGVQGRGVCQLTRRSDEDCPVPSMKAQPRLYRDPAIVPDSEVSSYLLPLEAPSCQSSMLAGGKGSQLAKLTSLQGHLPPEFQFEVPRGFVITTSALQSHVESNPAIHDAVKRQTAVSCALSSGSLDEARQRTAALLTETDISSDHKREIARLFKEIFGDSMDQKTFAVRSSAVGEDGKQMSAAGQLDTFLGIQTVEKVFEETRKCWASQYSLRAVQYRRQHGQKIDSSMAVVIQEMVPAQTAGVIFSRDPLTGNPARVIINANYGLGESVAAGLSEADTITLKMDESKNLSILQKKIGSKDHAIFISEDGGTETKTLPKDVKSRCSLAEDVCVKLGHIAKELDEYFGEGLDIEWAVVHDKIYLLQARPITTYDTPTQYELMHEFDSGHPSDSSWLTSANTQEVRPGCSSPLSLSASTDILDFGIQVSAYHDYGIPTSFPACKFCNYHCNQMLLSVVAMSTCLLQISELQKDSFLQSIGVMFDDSFIDEMKHLHAPLPSAFKRILNLGTILKNFWDCKARVEASLRDVEGYFTQTFSTAQEQYDDIIHGRYHADYPGVCQHYSTSFWKATFAQLLLDGILSRYSKHAESDFVKLLSSGPAIETAKPPFEIEQIARAIKEDGQGEAFLKMTSEQAVRWLRTPPSGDAGRRFSAFLENHGHRSLKEIGLEIKSWAMDPTQLIPSVQAYLKGHIPDEPKKKLEVPVSDLVDQLELPLPSVVRWMLVKWLVPMTRSVVAEREICKSMYIKSIHHFKQAYWRLAKLMVNEGLIPDEELLFYFSLTEIGQLLKERAPSLVARAHRRRRIEPELEAKTFPRLMHGRPEPIVDEEDAYDSRDVTTLEGTPICRGVIRGQAVVVIDLKNATKIKKGDILITRTTDIGWSPYFPILSGLVTEIGGVVSHGAIVAREYGIPCVVNIPKATSLIKSGEIVVVDGSRGTVEKQRPPTANGASVNGV